MNQWQGEGNDRDADIVDGICGYLTSTPPKSFFLFAGAGSGKTRTLVEVLRRLSGVATHTAGCQLANRLQLRGQSIRVITYTRNAVSVINGRLGDNNLVKVSTIHGFCWDLISGFNADIQTALLEMNSSAIQEAQEKANSRNRGPTEKDKETIHDLEVKADSLRSTTNFVYNPDRNTYGEGALQHDQVLSLTASLLDGRPTLRRVLADRHPIILIDESQDTMKRMLGVLMGMAGEGSSSLTLGLIGDHRQRIYPDGHRDLPGLVPDGWGRPVLQMNHRSQKRIVELINKIWDADLQGRTQPKTGVAQHPRSEKSGGLVRIFVGDTRTDSDAKIQKEVLCAEEMAQASKLSAWNNPDGGFQLLALEHKLAARRGKFLNAFEALSLIDEQAARPQGNVKNSGPVAVQVLLQALPALTACRDNQGELDEFAAIEVLNRFGSLIDFPVSQTNQKARLAELQEAVVEIIEVSGRPEATVREVIAPAIRARLFEADDRLLNAFEDNEPPPPPPKPRAKEAKSDKRRRGWHHLFNVPWAELSRYQAYLSGRSKFSTHQVVKGSEFEHVMVVMDDQEAGGFLFSYDKLFGAVSLSKKDRENMEEEKETSIDRTLRLLYVTCSRAEESLALVLWSSDTAAALQCIKASGWFLDEEIQEMPNL